eukprot:8750620-Prorocentrum_lima.AAC.1
MPDKATLKACPSAVGEGGQIAGYACRDLRWKSRSTAATPEATLAANAQVHRRGGCHGNMCVPT